MTFVKYITLFFALGLALFSCKTKKAETAHSAEKDTVAYNVMLLEKFFTYPVSSRKPIIIDTGNPEEDKKIYNLRLQHWWLIYETEKSYKKTYGALPKFYPGNVTLEEYKKNPRQPPDEYNKIMFGE